MIKFTQVAGDVMVDDRRGGQTVAVKTGISMLFQGADCIIVTGDHGRATPWISGTHVTLEKNSFIRIKPDGRSFLQKHKEDLKRGKKLFFGRLWKAAQELTGTADASWREELSIKGSAAGPRG